MQQRRFFSWIFHLLFVQWKSLFNSSSPQEEESTSGLNQWPIIKNQLVNRVKHSIANDLSHFLETGKKDIILRGKDNVEVKANKTILSVRSTVFAAMFSGKTIENIENKVEIKDLDGEVLREMVHFMYTDDVDNNNMDQYVYELFYASEKYDLKGLKMLCQTYLTDHLTVETFGETLWTAERCDCTQLKDECWKLFVGSLARIVDSDSWRSRIRVNNKLLNEAMDKLINKYVRTTHHETIEQS